MSVSGSPVLSLVAPVHDEEGSLPELLQRLTQVFASIGEPYEMIFVDDGSKDRSFEILRAAAKADPHIRVIRFTRNFGQTPALAAGIEHARGEYIVTIDADLQNQPEDIPELFRIMRQERVDVVSGWRKDRQDHMWQRRLPSIIANRLVSWFSGLHLHDYGCALKIYRAFYLKRIALYGEMHRFIPALVAREGGKVIEIPVRHCARMTGRSKYGLERVEKVLMDLFLLKFLSGYATRPIHFFGRFGLRMILLGGGVGLWTLYERFVAGIQGLYLLPLVLLTMLLFIIGLQTILMGLLAEIGIRTYHECQHEKHIYVIAEVVN